LDQGIDMVQGYEISPATLWISVDPQFGILEPLESQELDIFIDLTDGDIISDTTLQAVIAIHNNSADIPEIPVTIDAIVGIDDDESGLPLSFELYQNFPNPFNASTEIKFALPEQSEVTIDIFNILGQRVKLLKEGLLPAGYYKIQWDASEISSGVYYYRIIADDFVEVKKMTLLK